MRKVKSVIRSEKVNMGGIIIDQPLPSTQQDQLDPFLLIHHWYKNFDGGQRQNHVGVGPHPHRGFSPVTVIFKGSLHHRDSLGNSSIVDAGGVQWMNVGKGITHSERPSKEIAEKGGEFEIIQFWINSPSSEKMKAAQYIPLQKNEVPRVSLDGNSSFLNIIAGEYQGVSSKIPIQFPMLIAAIETDNESEVEIKTDPSFATLLYQLDGKTEINDKKIGDKTMLVFSDEGEIIKIKTIESSRLLLLSGKPIEESINSYGPFVMNSTTEIMEAIRDAQQGKMGILIEEFD